MIYKVILLSLSALVVAVSTTPVLKAASPDKDAVFLREAEKSRENIERIRRDLDHSLDAQFERLAVAISAINSDNLAGERMTIAQLRIIVPRLLTMAQQIIEEHERFQQIALTYGEELTRARPMMLDAAAMLRRYAEGEPYQDLKSQYLSTAETFEALAHKYQQGNEKIGPSVNTTDIVANLTYLQRTAIFLERLNQLLPILPSDAVDTDQFLKNLTKYAKAFERLRLHLQQFQRVTTGKKFQRVQTASGNRIASTSQERGDSRFTYATYQAEFNPADGHRKNSSTSYREMRRTLAAKKRPKSLVVKMKLGDSIPIDEYEKYLQRHK